MEAKVKYYERKLKEMLSNDDFNMYLPDAAENLITYKELRNFKTMGQLLEKPDFDFKILLVETERNSGHWCVLVRRENDVFWCDSYGMSPQESIGMIPKCIRRMLGQENDEVKRLYKSAREEGFNVHENEFEFQCQRYLNIFLMKYSSPKKIKLWKVLVL